VPITDRRARIRITWHSTITTPNTLRLKFVVRANSGCTT